MRTEWCLQITKRHHIIKNTFKKKSRICIEWYLKPHSNGYFVRLVQCKSVCVCFYFSHYFRLFTFCCCLFFQIKSVFFFHWKPQNECENSIEYIWVDERGHTQWNKNENELPRYYLNDGYSACYRCFIRFVPIFVVIWQLFSSTSRRKTIFRFRYICCAYKSRIEHKLNQDTHKQCI